MTTSEKVALNADVVGYSRLMADDFDSTTKVMDEYRELVGTTVRESGGDLVNFVGDNFMAVFDKPTDAMRASIAISAAIESKNADLPSSKHVRFRMGLDQGPVTSTGEQWFGDALNIAARIQSLALPGGVSVSGKVYRALDEPELRFRPRGHQHLKNIPEEVDVYDFSDLPSAGAGIHRSSFSLADPIVAVLPIHDESIEGANSQLGRIIRDELLHQLSTIRRLTIVDAEDEGPLNGSSSYALETGIHEIAGAIRVYSRLFDVSTWNIVASQKWTGKSEEIFELADEVAAGTARTVEIELIVGEPARLYADLGDPEAIKKVYTGWYHLTSMTEEGLEEAKRLFAEVEREHPEQTFGLVLWAFSKWVEAAEGMAIDREAALDEALELASRGAERGDPTGMADMVRAAVFMTRGDAEAARQILDEVEISRPTCDTTFALEGSVRRYLGEWEKSVDAMNTAMRLTAVTKPWYPTVQACSYFMGGRLEKAAEMAEAVVAYQPNNLEALLVLAATQVELGLDRRAKATADLVSERFPGVDVADWLEQNPYQQREMIERWKGDLKEAGAIN